MSIKSRNNATMLHPNTAIKVAFNLAIKWHADQQYGNTMYITHLMGVASQMTTADEIIVALLHDILEDTEIDVEILRLNFGNKITKTIQLLSKVEKGVHKFKSYDDFIQSIADSNNWLAIKVKLADLQYNLDHNPKKSLIKRYKKAIEMLKSKI